MIKKGSKRLLNYRPVSLLNKDSKGFGKMYTQSPAEPFSKAPHQAPAVFSPQKISDDKHAVLPPENLRGLRKNWNDDITIVHSDFAKAFNKVPRRKHLQEVSPCGKGCCLLDVLQDYLEDMVQFVRADSNSSKSLSTTSEVPLRSLLPTADAFINNLPDTLRFSEPYPFAVDLKTPAIGNSPVDLQIITDAIDSWVMTNHMELAIDKFSTLKNRGTEKNSTSLENL